MENKLEQLLNSLIEKGWKPFGRKDTEQVDEVVVDKSYYLIEEVYMEFVKYDYNGERNVAIYGCSIRELVSKESGLWQFVCDREHRFIDKKNYEGARSDKRLKNPYVDYDGVNTEYEWITSLDYQFRLIESALCDEDKLEDFLLSNIVIKDE